MNIRRRTALVWAAGGLAGAATGLRANEAGPITLIVPYPPGGLSDTLARLVGKTMAEQLGTPVIVENKPGANGVLGLQAIAAARPDGSVIGLVPASVMTVNPSLYKAMKVDTLRDITPLTLAITLPNVLVVNPAVPARTMDELVAYLKKEPGKVSYGSMGQGSSAHLNGELLSRSAHVDIVHVPYKGSGPVMQDLMAGNIQMAFENLPVALPMIQSGKLRAIGVTSTAPSSQAPDIAPIARSLPGFEDNIWFGFIAPARLPPATAARLHEALTRAIQSDAVARVMVERGAAITVSSPEEMRKTVAAEREKWARLVKDRNITVE